MKQFISPSLPSTTDLNEHPFQLYDDVDYLAFWSGNQQQRLNQAEHAIVKDWLPKTGNRIIDIGCGYGRLSDCYSNRFQEVIMLDGSFNLLRQARENTAGLAKYIACDLSRLPFHSGSLDNILMIRVLHHMKNPEACLSELHRILCNNGRLIFSYSNKQYAMRVIKWLAHPTSDSPFALEPSGINTTLISHHPKYINSILKQAGFTNPQYRGVGIIDRIGNNIRLFRKYFPTGERFAPILGKFKIAPWIFCLSVARKNANLIKSNRFEDMLMCLICGGNLINKHGGYECNACGQYYPIIDGILDFRTI
jgi:ubiquinone/menaquinone biosynthesis C-methylase UbiE